MAEVRNKIQNGYSQIDKILSKLCKEGEGKGVTRSFFVVEIVKAYPLSPDQVESFITKYYITPGIIKEVEGILYAK